MDDGRTEIKKKKKSKSNRSLETNDFSSEGNAIVANSTTKKEEEICTICGDIYLI